MNAEITIDADALDRIFERYDRTDAPGFAVGVAYRGQPVYRRGFGLASIELPVALSPGMRMRIGSTTKHVCCLAILLLAEAGRLSIDDSPRRHLRELPAWAEAMTLRQLMAHVSGMRDSLDLILLASGPGREAARDAQLQLLTRLRSVNASPGASWSYNNGGYVLLGEIVERLSGQTLAAFLREHIFAPIGMHDTLLRPLDTELLANSATLHVPIPGGGWSRGVFGTPIGGEGGIVSTVNDMLLWLRHMGRPVIGTAASWAAMRTPLATNGYGLGLFMDRYRGLHRVHHGGTVVGGASQMLKLPDQELDIILMSNGHPGMLVHELADAIIDACVPGLPPNPPESTGGPCTDGTFYSAATGRVVSLAAHEGRQTVTIGAATLPARREQDGRLSLAHMLTDLRLLPVHEGENAVALEVTEFGVCDRLERVHAPSDAAAPPGRYACDEAGILATIAQTGTNFSLTMASTLGGLDYTLRPLGPGLWEARAVSSLPLSATLEFDPDGFSLSTSRTTRLHFRQM